MLAYARSIDPHGLAHGGLSGLLDGHNVLYALHAVYVADKFAGQVLFSPSWTRPQAR